APQTLIRLACYAYQRGDVDQGHIYLTLLPDVLATRLGGITDVAGAVEGPEILRHSLNGLTDIVLGSNRGKRPCDVRLVAELRRDVIGRARILRWPDMMATDAVALADGLTEEVLLRLVPSTG